MLYNNDIQDESGDHMIWSIRKKLIIFLLLATVIPFTISNILTYHYTKESVRERFITTNADVMKNGSNDLTNYLTDIAQTSSRLYGYHPFIKVLQEGVISDIGNNQQEINRTLLYLYNMKPEIEQIHLYIQKGHDSFTIYNAKVSSRGKYEEVYKHPYYSRLKEGTSYFNIEPTHPIYSYNHLSTISEKNHENVLSFHELINEIPTDRVLGFLSIDVNLSHLSSISNRLFEQSSQDFYLMNDDGTIVYSSDPAQMGEKNKAGWFQQVKRAKSGTHSMDWKDKDFSGVMMYNHLSGKFKDWYVVKQVPYESLYADARKTALINILIGMISLVFVILATMLVSIKFTSPIKVLIKNMKRVEQGKFEVDFKSLGNDEFGTLGKHFTSMVETINDLIEREYKLEIENKSTQLRVLQSQVNPHFLYNTLQSIGTLALRHKVISIYTLLTSLSNIMRYSMNMREDTVLLSQEVQHVKSYLQLQKQRFDKRFEYDLLIDDEALGVRMPKMILQPLVENSFKHGLEQTTKPMKIEVKAYLYSEKRIRIIIQDTGKGMTQKEQNELQKALQMEAKAGQQIGLKNTYDRLKLYYGDEAVMEVKGEPNEGFIVLIDIPLKIDKEVNSV